MFYPVILHLVPSFLVDLYMLYRVESRPCLGHFYNMSNVSCFFEFFSGFVFMSGPEALKDVQAVLNASHS